MTIFLFAIFALLAIPLKSSLQALMVMSVIPFALVGAVGGHVLMGVGLNLFSLVGMLALIGVSVNDSLVMVDHVNQQKARGQDFMNAIKTSGATRFRAIMLTSLTTFFGLVPLIFEKSTQAQFLVPMAISLGFGVLFVTIVTLFLIPVNFLILEDIKKQLQKIYS